MATTTNAIDVNDHRRAPAAVGIVDDADAWASVRASGIASDLAQAAGHTPGR
jgi:hypothetical protein